MTTSKYTEPKIVLDGFPYGVNELMDPTHLRPGELAAVKNMVLRDGRTLESRLGQTSEHDRTYRPLAYGCKLLHRYLSLENDKRLLLVSHGKMYADTDDNRKFDEVVSITGTPAAHQFYDSVLFCSDEYELSAWRPDAGVVRPSLSASSMDTIFNVSTDTGTGGFLLNGYYNYRYTFDIYIGETFLGETGQLWWTSPVAGSLVKNYVYDQSNASGGTDKNKVSFARAADIFLERIPSYVKAVNIYRSVPLGAASGDEYPATEDFGLFWIGSVSMSDMLAASAGTSMFVDAGDPLGKQIRKSPLFTPPRSKLMAMHKGRLWMASPSIKGNDETEWTYYPDLVAFSAFEANGTEPLVFFPESTVACGAGEPDEITGMLSWRNQILLVWKANKMYAILGGDDELDFGIPNISIQLVDPNVGCIAPNTIHEVDGGIAWLSNRGPYIWDGTAARPLFAHKVKKSFERIPDGRRTKACAYYNSKEREYTIFYTDPTGTTAAYNRHYMTFSFGTQTWTMGVMERGVNVAMEVRDADRKSYALWGLEENAGLMLASNTPLVVRGESGFVESLSFTALAPDQNKVDFLADFGFLDNGAPFLDKKFKEIVIEVSSQVPLTLDILVDNKYDSRGTTNSITLTPPVTDDTLVWGQGNWGEKKWGGLLQGSSSHTITRQFDTIPVGKSIRPIISGVNAYDPVKIHSITIYYEPKEGTR